MVFCLNLASKYDLIFTKHTYFQADKTQIIMTIRVFIDHAH